MKRKTTQNLGKVVHTRQASYIPWRFAERVCHTNPGSSQNIYFCLSGSFLLIHFGYGSTTFFIPPQ